MFHTDTEIQFDHVALAVSECAERAFDFAAQRVGVFEVRIRAGHGIVFQHIEQRVVFTFHEGRVHRNVTGSHAERSFYFVGSDFEQFGQFFRAGFTFKRLFEFGKRLVDFIQRTYFVQGQTYDTALFGQGLQNALANPPNGVGNEFKTARFVETLGCFNQTQVAFVDQVRKAKSLILILFCNRNNKTQVGFGEFFEGYLVALLDAFGEVYFFFGGEKIHFTNFLKILFE